MKPEYDFSKGERGKFFQPEAELRLPIYLSREVQAYLTKRAFEKGVPLSDDLGTIDNHCVAYREFAQFDYPARLSSSRKTRLRVLSRGSRLRLTKSRSAKLISV